MRAWLTHELFVIDLERSIRFYEDALGFVVDRSEADYCEHAPRRV